MDNQLIINTLIYILSIIAVGVIQYLIGYKHGYKDARLEFKQELDKILEKYEAECTVTSTED